MDTTAAFNPTPAQIANRQLAASGGTPDSSPDLNAGNDAAASSLSAYLNGGTLSPTEGAYESGIMDRYNTSQNDITQSYGAEANSINADYSNQLDQANMEVNTANSNALTSNGGLSGAAVDYVVKTGTQRINSLETAKEQALSENDATMYQNLSQMQLAEQQNIQDARNAWVSSLTSAATLTTPEQANQLALQKAQQASVVTLQTQYPDAGITSSDTYDQASAKVRNSALYKQNISLGEANIQAAQAGAAASSAAAGASSASAAQTRVLTGLMQNGGGNDQAILAGLQDGTYSIADLPNLINASIDPQGVKRITAEFLANGGNAVTNEANAAATKANETNLGAGGYTGATTAFTNLMGQFLGAGTGTNPLSTGRTLTPPSTTTSTVASILAKYGITPSQ